ncbi:Glycosyl transferase group 1 [Methylocystis sp. SC2]|nr:Glycosyl transferase group 1 [Methylocystis sp. SC2]
MSQSQIVDSWNMKKSRLLIVTDDANVGGTYRVSEQLVSGLTRFFDVQFACAFNSKNAASRIAIATAGVRMHDYKVSEGNLERSTFAFSEAEELLENADPEMLLLIEAAEIWSLLALKEAAKRRAIPYVTAINLLSADCLERFTQLREQAIEAMQGAHAIIFVSNASKLRFEALFPQIGGHRYAIANSCPDQFFLRAGDEVRRAVRKALAIGDHELVFSTAARVEPRKGQILCLEALERIRKSGGISGIRLLLAGGGGTGHVRELQKAIETKALSDHVIFLGPRDDIPKLLEASDVFVLTSRAEGMPLSIIEAMAKGCPVIATDVDGIPEQIDQSSGILVPSPSWSEAACVAAIADAMTFMQRNLEARLGMGKCARERAMRLFGEDRMIREYADVLFTAAPSGQDLERERKGSWHRRFSGPEKASAISSISDVLSDFRQTLTSMVNGKPGRLAGAEQYARWELKKGAVIDFSDPVQCWSHARSGWHQTEPDGVWSDGTVSVIKLKMRRRTKNLRITFDLTPFVPPGHRQKTDVVINGREVASWDFDVHARALRTVDVSMRREGRLAEIQLIHRAPTSPQAVGFGDDSREIAVFLHEIRLELDTHWISRVLGRFLR